MKISTIAEYPFISTTDLAGKHVPAFGGGADRQANAGFKRHLDFGIAGQGCGVAGAELAARDEDTGAVAQGNADDEAIIAVSFRRWI